MTQFTLHYFAPFDRSARVRWTALELGLDFVDNRLNYQAAEHRAEPFLKLSPVGFVPAIEWDGQSMFESGAICLHLCETHADRGLVPLTGEPGRNECLSWLFHMTSTMDRACFDVFYPKVIAPNEQAHAAAIERVQPLLSRIDRHLLDHEYFACGRFTVADVMAGYALATLRRGGFPLAEYPAIAAYYDRVSTRPAAVASGLFKGL